MINTIKATINLTNVCLDEVDLGNGVIYRGDDLATTLEIKAPINSNAYVLLACITPNGRNLGPFNADNTTSSSTATTYEFLLTKANGYNFAVGRTELIVYYCVVNTNSSISKKAIGSICVDVKKGVSVDDEATFILGDTTDADAVLTDLNTKMDNLINQVASVSTQLSNKLDKVNGRVTLNNSGVLFTSRVELDTNYSELVQGTQGILNTVDSSTSTCEDEIHADRAICTVTSKTTPYSTEQQQTSNYITLKATDGTNTNTLAIAPQSVNINGVDVVVEDDLTAEATARQNADGTLQTNIDNEALARSNADTILQANIDASGHKIEVLKDLSTYQYTFVLFDANDNVLSSQLIDLPIESMIINVTYDATNKDLIFTLQNGTTLTVPLDDIVSGLASQDWVSTQLSTKADVSTTYTKSEVDTKLDAEKNYTDNIYTLATNNIAGKDTSTNILAKSSDSGIWVGTDTGHWYYWNGTQYADGGVYLATPLYFSSIQSENNTWITLNSVVNLNDYVDNNVILFGGFNNSSSNLPSGIDRTKNYILKVFKNNYTNSSTYTITQELIMLNGTYVVLYTRQLTHINNTDTWSSWIKTDKEIYYDTIVPKDYTWIVSAQTVNLNDYNNFNMIVFGGFNKNSTNLPNGIDKSKNYLLKVSRGIYHPNQKYFIVQELIGIDTPITYTRHFENINNAWTSWISPAKTRTQISITSSSDFITQMNNAYSIGNCDVNISIGEFDMTSLIETYYNNNQYGSRGRFIQLGNNCKYDFSSNTHLIANYTGSNTTLMLNFSMFNCDGTDFELNGLYATCKNLRYVIHDDPSSKNDSVGYTHIYNNCILELDNTTNPNLNYMDTIGGGIGANDTIIINGGRYKSIPNPSNTYPTRDLAYHSYGTSYYDYEFTDRFYITGVYFENTFAIGKINTTDNGTLYCQASNNSMSHTPYDGTGQTHGGYATLVLWNNEIRS